MNIEDYRTFCLSLPNCEESLPFDDNVLVYKVGGKMFSLASIIPFDRFAVKCDPDIAIELRDKYDGISGAYHLNKKHWNDVFLDRGYTHSFLEEQIVMSYLLVINRSVTPKAKRAELLQAFENKIK